MGDKYNIIGYSLESVIWARKIASSGEKMTYYKSGKLGYPLDDIREYISLEDINRIKSFGIEFPVKKLHNSRYVFIPYEQLNFVNSKNGLINFPLNMSSFESAEEWEQIEECIESMGGFMEELNNASNFVNIYKNFFPKWLYDSLLKYIGINKWGGFRQSKFTREGLEQEINLSYLDKSNTGTVYRPVNGYEEICKMLLDHENITVKEMDVREINKFITSRHRNKKIALMDNRVDFICNYSHGNFDRVEFEVERKVDPHMEEFMDIEDGIVLTPTKEYFCTSKEERDIVSVTSRKINTLDYCKQSNISPTSYNRKLYNEYKKLIYLYDRKTLNLDITLGTSII